MDHFCTVYSWWGWSHSKCRLPEEATDRRELASPGGGWCYVCGQPRADQAASDEEHLQEYFLPP